MEHVNIFLVFIEGVLSLFSPCVLPVLPIYLGIMANSSVQSIKDGEAKFINSPLLKNTVLFVLGISTTFFILGSSASLLNHFIASNKNTFLILGGALIIIMGIFYMGYINIPFLQKQKKINFEIKEMKPLTAFVLGFVFSFGWTPCIGPMLSSVLIMASTSSSIFLSNVLIFVYTIGFIVPFVIFAIFYSKFYKYIDKLKKHFNLIQKIGGAVLIASGLIMILSGSNIYSYYTNSQNQSSNATSTESSTKETKVKAPDFTLTDQYGKIHKLSDYKGKVIFLNFWATWCPPCRGELPHIEEIYKEHNSDNVVILGVTAPNLGNEGSEKNIKDFLNKNGYSFPVVFDDGGNVMDQYGIEAFPTTFIIDEKGYIYKYVPGAMDKAAMESLISNVK